MALALLPSFPPKYNSSLPPLLINFPLKQLVLHCAVSVKHKVTRRTIQCWRILMKAKLRVGYRLCSRMVV